MKKSRPSRQSYLKRLAAALHDHERSLSERRESLARSAGVHTSDARALLELRQGPQTVGAVSAALGLTSGAATALVDRLERRGLARRSPDPVDRRRVVLTLTAEGLARADAHATLTIDELAAMLHACSRRDIELLASFLEGCAARNRRPALSSVTPPAAVHTQGDVEDETADEAAVDDSWQDEDTDDPHTWDRDPSW